MRTWAKASTPAALLAVAVMSFAGNGTALADTSGDASVGGGNQVDLPISLPIDISGNSVAAAGSAEASSQGGAEVVNNGRTGISNRTSGDASVGGGNQINAPISAPVNACGNAVSLFGKSDAGCKGGATVRTQGKGGAGGNRTSGDASVLGGNQVTAPISAPLNACGNAVAIFGDATAGCKGGANVFNTGAGGNRTSGDASVLGGNQAVAPVSAPINICGNSVAVFGRAFSGCKGGSSVSNGRPGKRSYHSGRVPAGSTGNDTDGRFGAGSGNQIVAPVSLPVDVCGNAVGNASAGCKGGASVKNAGAGGNRTSGQSGVLSGNQAVAPVAAPVNICGNAAALLGHAFAGCKGGASVKSGGAGGNRTSGQSGVLSGNQAVAPIAAPVNICGNAAAALGASEAHCKGGAGVSRQHGGGGNWTSGRAGVLAGNQIVAPIAAPVNVCGNAAAVLGDAAAGCLGGAHVGKPDYDRSHDSHRFAHAARKAAAPKGGMLPMLPAVPALGGLQGVPALGALQGEALHGVPAVGALEGVPAVGALQEAAGGRLESVSGVTQQVQDVPGVTRQVQELTGVTQLEAVSGVTEQVQGAGSTALPLVEDAARTFGLPQLPELPGLPVQAQVPAKVAKPAKPAKVAKSSKADRADRARSVRSASPLSPATNLVTSTPVGGAVTSVTHGLPVGDIGLMSAAQPAGVTGMNSSSLLALVLGAMFAASATLFASARRFRFGRK
ncbi:chaplin family protein [Nonomuraea sp. SYSU D8015]|uniref:chaplin family protein n=1 Tax=Nonomuraea sp. SYSU D8015 TaxID=2593644 RepID=UPI0016614AF2|nr:chaplin family protein [Nonomuraea sp. SYSU D8015]